MADASETAGGESRRAALSWLDKLGDGVWRGLNSLPLAIAVMLLLAILSALGTVIPQEHLLQGNDALNPAQFYLQRFGELRYGLIHALGLTHIYFTPYFFILMVWLSVSAVVCNVMRLRRTLKLWNRPPVERGVRSFQADKRAVVLECAPAGALEQLKADLAHHGYRVRETHPAGGTAFIYGDKGFWRKWGLVALHFAVIVLLFGAVYGKTYGVQGWIRLNDGEKKALTLDVKEGKRRFILPLLAGIKPLVFNLSQDRFRIDYDEHIVMPEELQNLDPQLQEYYKYFVKQFVSLLSVEHNGRTKTQQVMVNHPLIIGRLVLSQSGYGQKGFLNVTSATGTQEYFTPAEEWLVLTPDGPDFADNVLRTGAAHSQYAFRLEQIKAGDLYVRGKKRGYIGPLTIVHLADVKTRQQWAQLLTPDKPFTTQIGGTQYSVALSRRVDNYSEFSYQRDPGIPILYFGWISLIAGIAVTLYVPFTQVWLCIEPQRVFMLAVGPGGARALRALYSRWRDILLAP
jgi:cytochrome c biogenesis protein